MSPDCTTLTRDWPKVVFTDESRYCLFIHGRQRVYQQRTNGDLLEGRKEEMFYLTTHSTHFIYSYMASDIWLRTILIVRKETRCHHIGYSFRLTARVLLYAPSHRQDSTYHDLCYTSHEALAGTRNSSMGPPHEGSIRRPIAPWANALTTELHLAPVTYCVLEVLPFGGESVMVWVGICGQKTPLVIVKGTLNYSVWHQCHSASDCPTVLPFLRQQPRGVIYQHHNARPITTIQNGFGANRVSVLSWPDISPIEHLWVVFNIMQREWLRDLMTIDIIICTGEVLHVLRQEVVIYAITGPDGAVAMSSTNGLVGTGFASRYRLHPSAGF